MQLTSDYNAHHGMEYIFKQLSDNARTKAVKLPAVGQNISNYVDELLTLDEQKLCDMATD